MGDNVTNGNGNKILQRDNEPQDINIIVSNEDYKSFLQHYNEWCESHGVDKHEHIPETIAKSLFASQKVHKNSKVIYQFSKHIYNVLKGKEGIDIDKVSRFKFDGKNFKFLIVNGSAVFYATIKSAEQEYEYIKNNPIEKSAERYVNVVADLPANLIDGVEEKLSYLKDVPGSDFVENSHRGMRFFGFVPDIKTVEDTGNSFWKKKLVLQFTEQLTNPNSVQKIWKKSFIGKTKVATAFVGGYYTLAFVGSRSNALRIYFGKPEEDQAAYFDSFVSDYSLAPLEEKSFYGYYRQSIHTMNRIDLFDYNDYKTIDLSGDQTIFYGSMLYGPVRKIVGNRYLAVDFAWEGGMQVGALGYATHNTLNDLGVYSSTHDFLLDNRDTIAQLRMLSKPVISYEVSPYRTQRINSSIQFVTKYDKYNARKFSKTNLYKLNNVRNTVLNNGSNISKYQRRALLNLGDRTKNLVGNLETEYKNLGKSCISLENNRNNFQTLKIKFDAAQYDNKHSKSVHTNYNYKYYKYKLNQNITEGKNLQNQINRSIRLIGKYEKKAHRFTQNNIHKVSNYYPKNHSLNIKLNQPVYIRAFDASKGFISRTSNHFSPTSLANKGRFVVGASSNAMGHIIPEYGVMRDTFMMWAQAHGGKLAGAQGLLLYYAGPKGYIMVTSACGKVTAIATPVVNAARLAGPYAAKGIALAAWGYCWYKITDEGILKPLGYREALSDFYENNSVGQSIVEAEVARQDGEFRQWIILQFYKPDLPKGYMWKGTKVVKDPSYIKPILRDVKQSVFYDTGNKKLYFAYRYRSTYKKQYFDPVDVKNITDPNSLRYRILGTVNDRIISSKRGNIKIKIPYSYCSKQIKVESKITDKQIRKKISHAIIYSKKKVDYQHYANIFRDKYIPEYIKHYDPTGLSKFREKTKTYLLKKYLKDNLLTQNKKLKPTLSQLKINQNQYLHLNHLKDFGLTQKEINNLKNKKYGFLDVNLKMPFYMPSNKKVIHQMQIEAMTKTYKQQQSISAVPLTMPLK